MIDSPLNTKPEDAWFKKSMMFVNITIPHDYCILTSDVIAICDCFRIIYS